MASPKLRSPAVARVLSRARSLVERVDRGLYGLELVNSTVDDRRGPSEWERMRSEARACFMLSTGRTGTTTLAHLLAMSPGIDAHHEPEPQCIGLSYLAWAGAEDTAFFADAMRVERQHLVVAASKRGRLYFEGNNRMTFLAPALLEAYPRAKFLLVSRRAKKFVASGMKRGYFQGHPWDYARPRPKEGWGDRSAEEKIAWLWRETYRGALAFRDQHPDRVLLVHAEDLFAAKLDVVLSVFEHLDVAPPPVAALQARLAEPTNAQVGVWPWGREPDWSGDPLAGCAEVETALGYAAE